MPIVVQCGACAARLTAPDQAAGKTVKCPKCQEILVVPNPAEADGFDVVDSPAPAPKPAADDGFDVVDAPPTKSGPVKAARAQVVRPSNPNVDLDKKRDDRDEPETRPKSKRRDEDDEDDDFDDRPRKKRSQSKKKSKLPLMIIIGGCVVLFGGCAGILGLAYMLTQQTENLSKNGGLGPNGGMPVTVSPPPMTQKSAPVPPAVVPAGWVKFNDPLNEIAIYFPKGQPTKDVKASAEMGTKMKDESDVWHKAEGNVTFTLVRSTIPASEVAGKTPESILNEAAVGMRSGAPGSRERSSVSSKVGTPSRFLVLDMPAQRNRMVVKMYLSGNRLLIAIATVPITVSETDPAVQPYINLFTMNK